MFNKRRKPSASFEPDIPVAIPVSEEYYGTPQYSSTTPQHDTNKNMMRESNVVGAAAVAGGVAGLVVAGPVLGIVGAVGAGIVATENSKAGDVARASGDLVLSAKNCAKKMNEKHHVVDKSKKATKKAASTFVSKAKEFEKKHHIGEKGLEKGMDLARLGLFLSTGEVLAKPTPKGEKNQHYW